MVLTRSPARRGGGQSPPQSQPLAIPSHSRAFTVDEDPAITPHTHTPADAVTDTAKQTLLKSPSPPITPPLVMTSLTQETISPQISPIYPTSEGTNSEPNMYQMAFDTITASAREILTKITEGKSVTSANKKRIQELAKGIISTAEKTRDQPPPKLPKAVSETIIMTIRESIREELKEQRLAPTPAPPPAPAPLNRSFSSATSAPLPRRRPVRTLPAIIVKSKETGDHQPVVYDEWRKNISFRHTTFAPTKVRSLRQNKLKVEFDTIAQRDETLKKVNQIPGITAEEAKLRRPLIILKGISKEVQREELIEIVSNQNQIPTEDIRLCFLLKNRNEKLYNAVLEVAPTVRRTLVEGERVNVEHQRVHVADFSRFLQCYKCLQFGHTNNKCTAEFYPCGHCGSSAHHTTTCPVRNDTSKVCCYNCKTTNSADTNHSALDSKSCPKIINAIKSLEENTDYGY
ncbi:uncharacterized protein LOC135309979 [Plodia interpunctella]|uniref:uncharacterized protein LOC135309979 n=1 Tax=Plodia interpunctella TaxID=58824 RepID=UPI003100C929